jgi:hypothetical protein
MNYQRIVFVQGDEAVEPLAILDREGPAAAIELLSQWDDGLPGQVSGEPSSGDMDDVAELNGYRLSWNSRLGYIGLESCSP